MEGKLTLGHLTGPEEKNHRKATWESRVTRWFPAAHGLVWLHLDLKREPDRPATASMTVDQAQAMITDLVHGRSGVDGLPDRPGVFDGDLDAISRVRLIGVLKALGVAEDTAMEIAEARRGNA